MLRWSHSGRVIENRVPESQWQSQTEPEWIVVTCMAAVAEPVIPVLPISSWNTKQSDRTPFLMSEANRGEARAR
jgi:hypothetical protein